MLECINNLFKKGADVNFLQLIQKGVVCFLDVISRNEAIHQLVEALLNAGEIQTYEQFFDAILKREQIVSTGIGMGVAIPHAKLENFDHFFLAVGIQKVNKGIEWGALDGAPVRLIFMIGGPNNQQTNYLKILSSLTMAIKDESRRIKILSSQSREQVVALFQGH